VSARWLIAFGVLIVAGVGAILLLASPPSHVVFIAPEEPSASSEDGGTQTDEAAAARAAAAEGTVQVSELDLDFGSVPILFPSRESFYLVNHGRVPVAVRSVSLEGPFRAETTLDQLDPKVATRFTVTFDPKKPGNYREHLRLTFADGKEVEVLVRGRGVLSPQAAGIAIPPRPDKVQWEYRAEKAAQDMARYRGAMEEMRQVSLEGIAAKSGGPSAPATSGALGSPGSFITTPVDDAGSAAAGRGRTPADARSYAFAAMLAFGEETGEDVSEIPVPITGGETTPDLPPGGGDEGEDDGAIPPADDTDDPGDPGAGDPDDPRDDGAGDDPIDKEDDADEGIFVIAPNSTVVVYSNKLGLALQALPFTLSHGSMITIGGRMSLPEFPLAFGEMITLEQWGGITGTIAPDGSVVMNTSLRVSDSGGASIVLPLQLTTGIAVGYSAAGQMFFDSGMKRDPVTGNVKMVGIVNIPIGQGSAIEKAPVYFAVLGRIQI